MKIIKLKTKNKSNSFLQDENGNVITQKNINNKGDSTESIDVTNFTYDDNNNVLTIKIYTNNDLTSSQYYDYDEKGRVLVWNKGNEKFSYEYNDNENKVIMYYTYTNSDGSINKEYVESIYKDEEHELLTYEKEYYENDAITREETYEYDDNNNVIYSTYFEKDGYGDENGTADSLSETEYEYDENGNMINQITHNKNNDAYSIYINCTYDNNNNLTSYRRIYASGNLLSGGDYVYNDDEQLIKRTEYGSEGITEIDTMTYNEDGEVASYEIYFPSIDSTKYSYYEYEYYD